MILTLKRLFQTEISLHLQSSAGQLRHKELYCHSIAKYKLINIYMSGLIPNRILGHMRGSVYVCMHVCIQLC
jgi:hypothetical protein